MEQSIASSPTSSIASFPTSSIAPVVAPVIAPVVQTSTTTKATSSTTAKRLPVLSVGRARSKPLQSMSINLMGGSRPSGLTKKRK